MKTLFTLIVIFVTVIVVDAANSHNIGLSLAARHAQLRPRAATQPKRCRKRPQDTSPTSSKASAPKQTPKEDGLKQDAPKSDNPPASGVINVKSDCGPIGATQKPTKTSGPNGSQAWLNCGIDSPSGWRPPQLPIHAIITKDLSEALKDSGSVFQPCKPYLDLFNRYGKEFDIQPIILASIALQESSCNPNAIGGGGERGMMQITPDKCGGAPNGNCNDPDFNVRTGANFFRNTLNRNGGNILPTLGAYNGWSENLTVSKATAARLNGFCKGQNNLDYLHQVLNGYLQNVNPRDPNMRMGTYFNLDVCD